MNKLLSHLLVLLLAPAMLYTMPSANALTKRPYFSKGDDVLVSNNNLRKFLINWARREFSPEMLKGHFIPEMAHRIDIDPAKLDEIINILYKEIQFRPILPGACQHRDFPFSFCICNNFTPEYRCLLILAQIAAILKQYPPQTTPQLVHTSFAEEGLLHTYCLIYALTKLGYHGIHVNVIGNRILESIAKNMSHGANEGAAMEAIQSEFRRIPGVTVAVYSSARDYEESVRQERAPLSNSFDMVDYEPELQVVYSTTPLSDHLIVHGRPLNRICATVAKPEGIGRFGVYRSIFVFMGNNDTGSIYPLRELIICRETQNEYKLDEILHSEAPFLAIAEHDIPRLLVDQPRMLNEYKRVHRTNDACLFLILANKKSNIEMFTELVRTTRVTGKNPIVFEASRNIINTLEEE